MIASSSNVRRQPADAGPGRYTELRSPVIASNSNVRRQPAHAGPGLVNTTNTARSSRSSSSSISHWSSSINDNLIIN